MHRVTIDSAVCVSVCRLSPRVVESRREPQQPTNDDTNKLGMHLSISVSVFVCVCLWVCLSVTALQPKRLGQF